MAKSRRANYGEKEPGEYFFRDTWKGCEVKALSYAAKGLWIDMLMEMTGTDIPGVLPGNLEALAEVLGFGAMATVWADMHRPLIEEMERKNVFSRGAEMGEDLPPDSIVNRRLYRKWIKALGLSETNRQNVRSRWDKRRLADSAGGVSVDDVREEIRLMSAGADTNAYEIDTDAVQNEESQTPTLGIVTAEAVCEGDTKKYLSLPLTKPTPYIPHTDRAVDEVREKGYAGQIYERLQKATEVKGKDLDWWRKVIAEFRKRGHLDVLEEHLRYVEMCADPRERLNKDLGALNQPGRYLAKNVLASARKLPGYHNRSTLPVPDGKWRLLDPPWQKATA